MNRKQPYLLTAADSRIMYLLKGILTVIVVVNHAHFDGINLASGSILFEQPEWFLTLKIILSRIILYCAVPGFFVMSSVLLYRRPVRFLTVARKKVRSLLIPYLIVNTFWILFYYAAQALPATRDFFSDPNKLIRNWGLMEFLDAYLGFGTSSGVAIIYGPLWYVRDLFCLCLLAVPIQRLIDRFPKLCTLGLLLIIMLHIQSPFFAIGSDSLFFFCLGYYLVRDDIHFEQILRIPLLPVFLLYAAAIALRLQFPDSRFTYLIVYADIFLGLLFWTRIAACLAFRPNLHVTRILELIAHYSFGIYILHQIPETILQKVLFLVLPKSVPFLVLEYFGIIAVILACCILFCKILERFMPRLYSILTGARTQPFPSEKRSRTQNENIL